jgi:hypothetical protein
MAEHTPGPWSVGHVIKLSRSGINNIVDWNELPVFVGAPGVSGGQGNPICIVHMGGPGATSNDSESLATNARLIAAAPELLAACKAIDAHLGTTFPPYEEGQSPYDKVRAAIAKAEGRSLQSEDE